MRSMVRLAGHFIRVCWGQGLRRAIMMAVAALPPKLSGVLFRSARPFPTGPSNSAAYLPRLKNRPLISIVMPVRDSAWLDATLRSVLAQSYSRFELILVDDASRRASTLKALELAARDARARVIRNETAQGISRATNAGIAAATGEFVGFMDHDDLLHPDALAVFLRTLDAGVDADVFYSDELRMNASGFVTARVRKCSISGDLLRSCNAVLHFCLIRRTLLEKLGRLDPEYDGAQDHDLMLRAFDAGARFCHMPFFLYAWRIHGKSFSSDTRAGGRAPARLPAAYVAGKKAVAASLAKLGIKAAVTDDGYPWYRVRRELPPDPGEAAIIVPFKDRADLLRRLVETIALTAYPRYSLWLVDNRSELPETKAYLQTLRDRKNIRIVEFDEPFNYSRLHNAMVESIPNEILVFMNSDIEILEPHWLEAMLEHIHRPGVGAVGARLLTRRGYLQHGGMAFTPTAARCAFNLDMDDEFYTRVQREVSGVSAACMMIRRSVFRAVGGFDEVQFPIGFSDADLCLRLRRAGHSIIYTPFAVLGHNESASRKTNDESYEKYALCERHAGDSAMRDRNYKTIPVE